MDRSNPRNANSHTTWAPSTRTLVDGPRETRIVQHHTLNSMSTAGPATLALGPVEEPRSVEYLRIRVARGRGTPQVPRPTRTDSGAPQGQVTLQDGTSNALMTGRAVRARNIVGGTTSPTIRVTTSTQRTPQTIQLRTPERQPTATANIPSGSRIDKWREDVARAIGRVPAASASTAPQISSGLPHNLPQRSTVRQPRPVRYYEYVHGPDDGVSHHSSEDGLPSRRHEEFPGPSAWNDTPYPSSSSHYGRRLNTVESTARFQGAGSVDRDLDPLEY